MEIMANSFKQFTEMFNGASFHINNNVSIYKSGIDHWSMNFCFVSNEIVDSDIDFIKNKFDINGIIFSSTNFNEDILKIETLRPIGKFPIMLREEIPDFYKAPVYDDIEILSVSDYPMIFGDFIDVFSSVRGIEKDYINNKINIDNLKNNNHFFVAYMSDIPVGSFYAISNNEDAFTLDVSVKENYRNTGILNAMAKKAKEEALKKDIFNFYSIPTSEFSVRVMNDQGYKMIGSCFLWQNVKWYN